MPRNIENLSKTVLGSVDKVETLLDNKAENAQKYQESLKIPHYYRSKKVEKVVDNNSRFERKIDGGGLFPKASFIINFGGPIFQLNEF